MRSGLLAAEWVAVGYLALSVIVMAIHWDALVNPAAMVCLRVEFLLATLAAWLLYRWHPCRALMFGRVAVQMIFLSWWYPDTYELNRVLPNLDHLFAGAEQALFGCQPSLLFSRLAPWPWFSELMCLGYISYFPLIAITVLYYFFRRYQEFRPMAFIMLATFFAYYVIFIFLPVTGPQFYYLAAGADQIADGVFPSLGDWFLTHSERMSTPGWSDGFFYHLLEVAHNAGERPTAAFPSSHVGVTTVIMLLALRTRCRSLIGTVFIFYVIMCFATVYIYAHYVIDALGGLVTGVFFYSLFRKVTLKIEN